MSDLMQCFASSPMRRTSCKQDAALAIVNCGVGLQQVRKFLSCEEGVPGMCECILSDR